MSNNNQTNDIYNISGVEDLSCDTAANIQGGLMDVYKDNNLVRFLGRYYLGTSQLGPKSNDKISSVHIISGQWRFYENGGPLRFFGRSVTLGPGKWNITTLNERISAFGRIDIRPTPPPI